MPILSIKETDADDWPEIYFTVLGPTLETVESECKATLLRLDVFREGQNREQPPFVRMYKSSAYRRFRSGFDLPEPWRSILKRSIRHTGCPLYEGFCSNRAVYGHRQFNESDEAEWRNWTCKKCPQYQRERRVDIWRHGREAIPAMTKNMISGIGSLTVQPVREEIALARCGSNYRKTTHYQIVFDLEIRDLSEKISREESIKTAGRLMSETGKLVELFIVKGDGSASPVDGYPYDYYLSTCKVRPCSGSSFYELRLGSRVEFLGLVTLREAVARYKQESHRKPELWQIKSDCAYRIDNKRISETAGQAIFPGRSDLSPDRGKKDDWIFAVRYSESGIKSTIPLEVGNPAEAEMKARTFAKALKSQVFLVERKTSGKLVKKPIKI